jgi:uncharacterized repeat protein (TIGR01451 family)
VPIRVIETDGQLASFWFYGEQSQTKYTDTNVYWLTYDTSPPPGAEPGLRMPTRSVPPAAEIPVSAYYLDTIRFEEDHVYRSNMPWAEDFDPDPWDHWFWNNTNFYWPEPDNPSYKKVQTFPGQLSNLSPSQYTTALTVFMSGYSGSWKTYPDHCTEFRVNGALIGQYSWDGQYTDELVSFAINSNILEEGPNTVEAVVCPSGAQWDNTYYDWFAVDVRRIYQAENDSLTFDVAEAGWQYRLDGFSADTVELFDISDTYAVSHLINVEVTYQDTQYTAAFYDAESGPGTRYLALTHDRLKSPLAIEAYSPANLADPANQADYIVIAPPEFVPDVQPLATHREGQGLTVQVVELGTIFDEFNYGIYSPEAIRDFLSYAFHNWAPDAPAYVLLVGDGTYDYKGNIPQGNPNLLPPYLAWVDPWIGETAADNRYVTVAGDDPFPDMHIGRLPAENITQLQTMVAKTISYEIDPAPQDWVERVLFVTDDYPDSSGNFYDFSDDLVNNYLPDPYVPVKAYYLNTCLTGAACTQAILDTLNTTGALFVNYIGHGGVQVWAGYPATIWRIDDLAGLVPTSRLPVMLPMTCSEGSFHQAEKDALAEATVRLDGRGAVASWSATGLGVADGHDYLNKGFLHAALYEGVRELGAAADAGKARLFAANFSLDLLDTYHVLGDPALRLHSLPVVDVAVGQAVSGPEPPTPGDLLALTLTFTNTGPDVAAGVVLTDLLPSVLVTPVVVFSSPEVIGPVEGITLAWTINDLAPGASGTIVVETTVDPDWPEPEVSFFNKAQIAVQTHDLEPQNNVSWLGVNTKSVYLPLILKAH